MHDEVGNRHKSTWEINNTKPKKPYWDFNSLNVIQVIIMLLVIQTIPFEGQMRGGTGQKIEKEK